MKYALILFATCLFACKQSAHDTLVKPLKIIDTSWYVILKFDRNRDSIFFDKKNKPADISYNDILLIDSTINDQIVQYNKTLLKNLDSIQKQASKAFYYSNSIKKSEKYYKQVLAVINSKREKEVWIYCTCSDDLKPSNEVKLSLKEGFQTVEDGGNCFFQLEINLTTGKVLLFRVNGVG
jgi:hypothetical protein